MCVEQCEGTHTLDSGCDSCNDKQGGEWHHHPIGEVVDREKEWHEADQRQHFRLHEGVGQVVLDSAPEHDLQDGYADVITALNHQRLVQKGVLDQLSTSCNERNINCESAITLA